MISRYRHMIMTFMTAAVLLCSLFSAAPVQASSGAPVSKVRIDVLDTIELKIGTSIPLNLSSYVIDCEDDTVSIAEINWYKQDRENNVEAAETGDAFTAGSWFMEVLFEDPNDSLPLGADISLVVTVGDWSEVSGDWTCEDEDSTEKRYSSPVFEIAPLSGSCGENAAWKMNLTTGKLRITGSGPLDDHSSPDVPWASYKDRIKSVSFADGITRIGDSAFESCFSLQTVSFPANLKEIGAYAFSDCEALKTMNLPDELEVIGQEAFSGCELLSGLKLPAKLKTIGDSAFSECAALTEVEIPESVTTIGDSAFRDCESMKNALLPFSLAALDEDEIFAGCRKAKVLFDLTGAAVDNVQNLTYTGKALTQTPVVGDSSIVILKKKRDYKITYENNLHAGTATMIVTGQGRYTGSLWKTFKIRRVSLKKNQDVKVEDIPDIKYTGEQLTPVPVVTYGANSLKSGTDFTTQYTGNIEIGTATVQIKGKGDYTGTVKKQFRITKFTEEERKSIESAEVTGVENQTYTGKRLKPAITVMIEDTVLKRGTDYKLSYKNNKKIGKASVTIRGIGEYKGSRTETFSIVPKKTRLKKLTATKKTIRAAWVRMNSSITGYQIQYATDKNFESVAGQKRISGADKGTYTIKKLKRHKTYYVRIRVYKKVGKKRYYSSWSKVKKVRTK